VTTVADSEIDMGTSAGDHDAWVCAEGAAQSGAASVAAAKAADTQVGSLDDNADDDVRLLQSLCILHCLNSLLLSMPDVEPLLMAKVNLPCFVHVSNR
jgi:hypothetical protein